MPEASEPEWISLAQGDNLPATMQGLDKLTKKVQKGSTNGEVVTELRIIKTETEVIHVVKVSAYEEPESEIITEGLNLKACLT